MTKFPGVAVMGVVLLISFSPANAQDSDEIRDQRRSAEKERQLQRSERNEAIKNATRELKDYTRELRSEYRDRINDLETKFELRRVELRAEHDVKVAEAQAENQKKMAELFMRPDITSDEAALRDLQTQARSFSDELFELKNETAATLHRERMANEMRKNEILTERDRLALEKARSLGLMQDFSPILASPIGDGLTPKEERWNQREREEVARLKEKIAKLLSEYTSGEALRKWEIQNLQEDFKLEWDEKSELHALDSEQIFYAALLAQAGKGGQLDRKKFTNEMAELTKQKELIGIRYKETRDRNRIKRREEKKELLAY